MPAGKKSLPALLSKPATIAITGLSSQTINEKIKSGRFPKGIRGEDGRLYFYKHDVDEWLASRSTVRCAGKPIGQVQL